MDESSRKILHAPAVNVRTALAALPADSDLLKSFHIDVTTKDRVVTLQGRVKTEDAREKREKAERMARETDGVLRVVNLVKVGDPQ